MRKVCYPWNARILFQTLSHNRIVCLISIWSFKKMLVFELPISGWSLTSWVKMSALNYAPRSLSTCKLMLSSSRPLDSRNGHTCGVIGEGANELQTSMVLLYAL